MQMITVNTIPITPTIFPDGTQQVWQLPVAIIDAHEWHICWTFTHEAELITLLQLCALHASRPSHLELTYLPYGRQDKPVSNEATFALQTFIRVLALCELTSITVLDPHSSVILEALPQCRAIYPIQQVTAALNRTDATAVVYPDAGAVRKYTSIYQTGCVILTGHKERDQHTGTLRHVAFDGNPAGQRVLIIDDICDGGRTFTTLATALHTGGATAVHLFVSHGIFSKGIHVLTAAGIGRVFTARGEVDTHSDTPVYRT